MHIGDSFAGPSAHLEVFADQLTVLTAHHPEMSILGSVGRQAIMTDYSLGAQPLSVIRPNGKPRDIDVISANGDMPQEYFVPKARSPYPLDSSPSLFFGRNDQGIWVCAPEMEPMQLEEDILLPVRRDVGGVVLHTLGLGNERALRDALGDQIGPEQHGRKVAVFERLTREINPAMLRPEDRLSTPHVFAAIKSHFEESQRRQAESYRYLRGFIASIADAEDCPPELDWVGDPPRG